MSESELLSGKIFLYKRPAKQQTWAGKECLTVTGARDLLTGIAKTFSSKVLLPKLKRLVDCEWARDLIKTLLMQKMH